MGVRDASAKWAEEWDDFSVELERIVGDGGRGRCPQSSPRAWQGKRSGPLSALAVIGSVLTRC